MITASLVKELREKTGVAMMECKNALKETEGDIDAAIKILRERGEQRPRKRLPATLMKESSLPPWPNLENLEFSWRLTAKQIS